MPPRGAFVRRRFEWCECDLDIRYTVDIYNMNNVPGLRTSIMPTDGHFLPTLQERRRRKRDRIMRRVKVYASLFWFLFAVLTCVQASRLDMGEMSTPGPGFFSSESRRGHGNPRSDRLVSGRPIEEVGWGNFPERNVSAGGTSLLSSVPWSGTPCPLGSSDF